LGISINASAAQLPGYASLVRRSLESSGLAASRLTVEVCEPGVVGTATAALRELAGLGSTVALDEFGTGHSSLMDLRRFPVGQLKIDCSYVAGLGRHRDDDAMVSSIVSLGRALGITCVALGVEATGQVEQLLELGCERAQGPLFSQPVPVDHVPAAIDAAEAWAVPARPKSAAAAGRDAVAPVPDGVLLNMQQMHAAGASYATIAASLNQMGSRHPAGRHWHRASVARVLADSVASRSVSA
jgi:predicted signal transduction protein with EAL and GGDEF domain